MAQLARTCRKSLLAFAALVAPTALSTAHAQTAAWSKSSAILGGAPSALEMILARQGAADRATLRPASLSLPVRPTSRSPILAMDDVHSGRPDLFGTTALRLGHTRLDSKWRQVNHVAVHGPARSFAQALRGDTAFQRADRVNRYVNRAVQFVADSRQFGRPDVWSAANDTLRRGRGDCEDYAIAKLQMLREAGIADRDLFVVLVRDLVRRDDHAVLVIRADDHFYLLDNGTDQLLDSNDVQDYRPIITFAADGAWAHGYRVQAKPKIELASAADQRSRSASLLAFNTGFSR